MFLNEGSKGTYTESENATQYATDNQPVGYRVRDALALNQRIQQASFDQLVGTGRVQEALAMKQRM